MLIVVMVVIVSGMLMYVLFVFDVCFVVMMDNDIVCYIVSGELFGKVGVYGI